MRKTLLALAAVAVIALSGAQARADEVFISGYTNGCFNCGSPPNTSATQTASLDGLTYVNSTFSGTTAGGFRGIGGNPIAPPTQNVNNLGAFTLATQTPFTFTGNTFTLRVTFTAPEGITGSNTVTFGATLTGAVTGLPDSGGVFINFNNTPILFTFSDPNWSLSPTHKHLIQTQVTWVPALADAPLAAPAARPDGEYVFVRSR